MARTALLLFILLLFLCGYKKEQPAVSCTFISQQIKLTGFSDTTGKFYQHHWPDIHTPETFQKSKQDYRNVLCGRIVSMDMDTAIELWIKWPKGTPVSATDIMELKNDTIWTLNSKGKKSNYNQAKSIVTGKSFQMLYYCRGSEYLSDTDPLGYICLRKIEKTSEGIFSANGIFSCTLHGSDYQPRRMANGKFNVEFYIGL